MVNGTAKSAQSFPDSGGLARVSQRSILVLMLGTVALPVSGAWAQQILSGAQTTTQSPTGSPLAVTTSLSFSVDTTGPTAGGGIGVDLYSTGGISFTDTNQATITGFTSGINARNNDAAGLGGGGGTALTITTTGVVTSKDSGAYNPDGDGIFAENQYGGDLTISVTSVTGNRKGIVARAIGNTGALSITATGAVIGTNRAGIDAYNQGTDLTISANTVSGGIVARTKGSGLLSITTTGEVIGSVQAINQYGTSLTINTAKVSGEGIVANHYGSGALQITASGDVSGGYYNGIYVQNSNNGTDLTISATSVSGGGNGISAKNKGTGALSITTTGAVSAAGEYSDGISAVNYGTDLTISVNSVSGGKYEQAVFAQNKGSGKLSITVSGAIVAGADSHAVGIQTLAEADGEVAIHLLSTSSVGGPEAITDLDGDAVVTIDAGALVTGSIQLNYGNDTLTIASGVNLSGVTQMSGGSDDDFNSKDYSDTLNISSGWSGILDDWEVINADTSNGDFALGGFTLGDRSFSKLGAGTLTLNGAMTLEAGSTLSMGVPQEWADPLIVATGAATIAGDLIVTPGQTLTFGQEYTLIEASALTGTFGDVSILGGYKTTLRYTGTSVLLRFDPDSLTALVADSLSPNARAVAAAFDAAVDGGYDPQVFANLYTQADTLNAKLLELSGELHSAERRVALADTSVVRDAALNRLGGGLTGGAAGTFWAHGLGSWGKAEADGTGAKVTTQQSGVLSGVDFAQGDITYGGMFSYTNTDVDLASLGHSDVASTGAAVYAGYRQAGSGLAFGMGGALASTSAKGERSISLTGLEQTLTSTVQGTSYQVFGEVSNDMAEAGNLQIEPFARFAYAKVESDAFAETGGSAALSGAAQSNDLRTASIGLRGAYVAGSTTLSGSAAWQHSAGDLSAPTTLSMGDVNTPYEVNSAAIDQDILELAAQASVHLSSGATLAGGYIGTIGKTNSTHGLRVTLSMEW